MDALVQRLVQNPHDQDAIMQAHGAGGQDPRAYAMLLEKVGTATADPALASHWLTEAANVWILSLNDAHRAARALMIAIDRDPAQPTPAERLAELYREKGDTKALAALLERRAKALAPLAQRDPAVRGDVAGIHEELGRLWSEPPLANPAKAVENYRRALEYDPGSQYSIYAIRETYKAGGQIAEAIPYYALEQALVEDPERRVSLYADEAEARLSISDFDGALQCLENARQVDPADPALKQQLATMVLERVRQAQSVDESWKAVGSQLFVELAEEYSGEHGYAYSTCALEILPGHDRAVQLAMFYGDQLGRGAEVAPYAASYLKANPNGALAGEAARAAGGAAPRAAPAATVAATAKAAPAAASKVASAAKSVARKVEPAERAVEEFEAADDDDDDEIEEELEDEPEAPEVEVDAVEALLKKASQFATKNRKNEAAGVYRDVLKADATNSEALEFLQNYLRQARKYGDLRDVLLRAARAEDAGHEDRIGWLREVASLCESQIRDLDTAIHAWQQLLELAPGDAQGSEQLRRLLERANRWDDLAILLQQEAEQETDTEVRIVLEKQVAKLHETKRKDVTSAGHAWARVAALSPEDDTAVATAVKLFEKAERLDLAAQVIADCVGSVTDDAARAALNKRLGELRRGAGDFVAAGDAFSEAARLTSDAAGWESAERAYADGQAWPQAAAVTNERAQLAKSSKQQAELFALEAAYLVRAGDAEAAITRLDQAVDVDPTSDEIAAALERQLEATDRSGDIAPLLLRRAEKHPDKVARIHLRKRAATLQRDAAGDPGAARESLELVLEDGDDAEALSLLADDAEARSEFPAAVEYLARLARVTSDRTQHTAVALRQAALLAEGVKDLDGAVEQYQRILDDLDPGCVEAMAALANLEERREKYEAAAHALERHMKAAPAQRGEIAARLADLYEFKLDDLRSALRSLHVVFAADPDDFQAIQRIVEIAERLEEWGIVAEQTARLVEVEGDDEEVSRMTRHLAEVLADKLSRGEEALTALAQVAEQGDVECREAFVALGDRLEKKKLVATKLVEWFGHAAPSPTRDENLHGAFERFVEVGADPEAASIAKELARLRIARPDTAERLEVVAVRLKDLDALSIAHDLIVRELSGPARASEMVRQAEVLVTAGVDPLEAVQHGEQALTSVAPADVEPLLDRLGKLADAPGHVIDLYERQIGRCKSPGDRLGALARAAQIAGERDALDRARGFFDMALATGAQEDTLSTLESVARASDEARKSPALRTTLAEALAAGGQGSRDGGRTRGTLLRRAAVLIYRELGDRERAFGWLGDALVTHVDDAGLDALVELAQEVGEPQRGEVVLSRALAEVFDGPLVRKLLGRRAAVRADLLGNKPGAAEDLKRLHELAPADTEVMETLSALYTELQDYRGMVQLFEDQILRGRDQGQRAELARKVAQLWEERLDDAREAADAWRRVLRMKAGDVEATAGLERAKSNMLRKPDPEEEAEAPPKKAAPPPKPLSMPAPALDAPQVAAGAATSPAEASPKPPAVTSPSEPAAKSSGLDEPAAEPSEVLSRAVEVPAPAEPASKAEAPASAEQPGASAPAKAPLDPVAPPAAAAPPPLRAPPPLPPVAPAAPAAGADDEIEVDMSGLDAPRPPSAPARPSRPPPPSARGSLPPPPPPRGPGAASSGRPPPPPPSMRASRPPTPPPPPARTSVSPRGPAPLPSRPGAPPPPPSIAAAAARKGPGAGAKSERLSDVTEVRPPPGLGTTGEDAGEDDVGEDEVFE